MGSSVCNANRKRVIDKSGAASADLLLQGVKFRRGKEFAQGDIQPVAQLFDGGHGGAVVAPAGDVTDGGRRDAAKVCQLVWRNPPLAAKGVNACPDRFTDIYDRSHPNSFEMISV